MQITAQLNNLRMAPRKVRLVSAALKGLNAIAARRQLDYILKRSAKPIAKLLDSALANAYNNFGLVKENLFIKDIVVDEGPKLKRFRPKGFSMVSPIEKKTSRIRIILDERVPGMKAEKRIPVETKPPAEIREEKTITAEKKSFAKGEVREIKKPGMIGKIGGLGRRFFRRKAI